jgi:hypothetical protein
MQLRLTICLILAAALAISPAAYAQAFQPTTSIVALNYYRNIGVGSMVTVSFDVTYATNQNLLLLTEIECGANEANCSSVSMNGVDASPFPCNSTNPFGDQQPIILGTCSLAVSTTGADFFSYNLSFTKAGIYTLTALSWLSHPGDPNKIPGSQDTSQTMTITVT